jgi:hypothetical protein
MAAYVLHLKTANYANTESRKRAELKKRSPEEQQLYAERACASQAKYREKYVFKPTPAANYSMTILI